jgi:hypothetical protein
VNKRTKIGIGVAGGAAALALGIGGVASAMAGDEEGAPVSGAAADQARAAAVAAVPGGRAGEVEAESDEGNAAYGVIVTKPDGSQVEVHLDRNYQVLDTEPADQDGDDEGGDGDAD